MPTLKTKPHPKSAAKAISKTAVNATPKSKPANSVKHKPRLTDTQLLRMPKFRGDKKNAYDALLTLRGKISAQFKFHSDEALDAVKNSSGELTSMSTHMADAGSDNFLHDMELSMMTGEGNVLELIDEAIQRLVDDEYGKCLQCGCNINPERLEAIPYAQYCIRCKSSGEKNGGFPLDQD